jgi:hypothetical protein
MRFSAPFNPAEVAGTVAAPLLSAWVENMRKEIFQHGSICEVLKSPRLGFDETTAESICKQPERAIGFGMVDAASSIVGGPAFEITFSDSDNVRAYTAVKELVSEITARDEWDRQATDKTSIDKQVRLAHEHGLGEQVTILESPIKPEQPSTHYRITVIIAGALMGLTLGFLRNCGRSDGTEAPALATAHP